MTPQLSAEDAAGSGLLKTLLQSNQLLQILGKALPGYYGESITHLATSGMSIEDLSSFGEVAVENAKNAGYKARNFIEDSFGGPKNFDPELSTSLAPEDIELTPKTEPEIEGELKMEPGAEAEVAQTSPETTSPIPTSEPSQAVPSSTPDTSAEKTPTRQPDQPTAGAEPTAPTTPETSQPESVPDQGQPEQPEGQEVPEEPEGQEQPTEPEEETAPQEEVAPDSSQEPDKEIPTPSEQAPGATEPARPSAEEQQQAPGETEPKTTPSAETPEAKPEEEETPPDSAQTTPDKDAEQKQTEPDQAEKPSAPVTSLDEEGEKRRPEETAPEQDAPPPQEKTPEQVPPLISPEGDKQPDQQTPEQQQAEQLAKDKQDATRDIAGDASDVEGFSKDDVEKFVETQKLEDLDAQNLISDMKTRGAAKMGASLGKAISRRISTGSFSGFLLALGIATIKDLIDAFNIPDLGIVGSLVGIFFGSAMAVILITQIGWMKRIIVKHFIKRFALAFAFELVPGINLIPFNIFLILWIKKRADVDLKKHKKAYADLQERLNEVSRMQGQIRASQKKTQELKAKAA